MKCRACNGNTEQFLSLGQQPLPNRFLLREQLDQPEPRYPLELYFCSWCSLVQLGIVAPPEDLFSEYLFASSTSPLTRAHFTGLAAHLQETFHLDSDSKVVDIASNDGIMLRAWRDLGVSAIGVEPAKNLCELAWADGLHTLNEFFTNETVGKIGPESAHLVSAINVLAHVPDLDSFCRNVKKLLRSDGVFVAEVQYFRDTLTGLSFDNCYLEHVYYFTLTSLARCLSYHGLPVFAAERVNTHGGSLRVYAHKLLAATPGRVDHIGKRQIIQEEQSMGLYAMAPYRAFAKNVAKAGHQLRERLLAIKADGKSIAGYGAAAKSTTILNFAGVGPETIDYIVDDSPLKQGTWSPGVHIPIVGPEELRWARPDVILVLAWNHLETIKAKTSYLGADYIIPVETPERSRS